MTLRDTANKVELTDEQRKRVAERNAEMDARSKEQVVNKRSRACMPMAWVRKNLQTVA